MPFSGMPEIEFMMPQRTDVLEARPDTERHVTARPGAPAAPSRLQIVQAIPAGSRRARDQRAWLRAVAAAIDRQDWYACRAAHTAEVARLLARAMHWHHKTSRPGHEQLAAAAGISLRTVRRIMRWLEAEGLAGLVTAGTTPQFSPGVLVTPDAGNIAAEYVLTTPRPAPATGEFGRPSCSRREHYSPAHAPEARAGTANRSNDRAPRGLPRVPRPADPWPTWQAPENRSDSRAAAEVIRSRARLLARLSAEHWRSIARRFTAAGWSPGDVLHALDHEPGGRRHGWSAEVRSVAGWARWRLSLWLDSQGDPLPAPSQRRAAERDRVQAEQSARSAERLRTAGRVVDVAAHAAAARAMLAGRPRLSVR
jgi:hypothetical protein